MSAKNTTFASDFDKKLADNELYIRFTICSTVWRLLLNQVVLIPKKVDTFPEIVDLSISQQNHPITLKTFKTPKTFPLKICTSANFVVPLQREPALEGVCLSCEKCFAKDSPQWSTHHYPQWCRVQRRRTGDVICV